LCLYPVVPTLVVLCLFLLDNEKQRRHTSDDDQVHQVEDEEYIITTGGAAMVASDTFIDDLHSTHTPLARFATTLIVPLFAIPTYLGMVEGKVKLEMNAIVILIAGPFSVAWFFWASFVIL